MKNVGFIGQRGMVGSVLMDRLKSENSFKNFKAYFFSTSQVGQNAPEFSHSETLLDAYNIKELKKMDILLSCQGGSYTELVIYKLRETGWKGYWIDAASTLRMSDDSILVLDPVNLHMIKEGIHSGVKSYIGANCTVSLMLMAIGGLFKNGHVEWVSSMTYQAASGAGARHMIELIDQMGFLAKESEDFRHEPGKSILEIDRRISQIFSSEGFPNGEFQAPLAGNLIPWIDKAMENGQTREEWKAMSESHKILGGEKEIPVDGTCVRVGAMRCHSQGLTVKLNSDIPLDECEDMIKDGHQWLKFVHNDKEESIDKLAPAYVSGSLDIPVGRVRKMNLGKQYLNVFTVGDQLLWGAAEPLKRVLELLIEEK